MSLEKRTYSVLLISAAQKFNSTLSALLSESKYKNIRTVSGISAAKQSISEYTFDFVIINSPLPDDTGIRFAIDSARLPSTVVLLLVRAEMRNEIYDKVTPHGVFLLTKPTSKSTVLTALDWLASARERLRMFEKKTLSIEEKMAEIRLVNQAKWILIDELKIDEPKAHRYIEKQAMDRCITKREVAMQIINGRKKQKELTWNCRLMSAIPVTLFYFTFSGFISESLQAVQLLQPPPHPAHIFPSFRSFRIVLTASNTSPITASATTTVDKTPVIYSPPDSCKMIENDFILINKLRFRICQASSSFYQPAIRFATQ